MTRFCRFLLAATAAVFLVIEPVPDAAAATKKQQLTVRHATQIALGATLEAIKTAVAEHNYSEVVKLTPALAELSRNVAGQLSGNMPKPSAKSKLKGDAWKSEYRRLRLLLDGESYKIEKNWPRISPQAFAKAIADFEKPICEACHQISTMP